MLLFFEDIYKKKQKRMGMREIIFQIRGGKSQEEWGFSENQGKCKLFFLIYIDNVSLWCYNL